MGDDFGALRSARFRELLAGRLLRTGLFAGGFALVLGLALMALASGAFAVLALLGAAALVVLLGWAWSRATEEAEERVLSAWGARHGLAFVERPSIAESTPFLRRGDRREYENGLVGTIGGCAGSVLCHVRIITKHRDSKGDETEQTDDYTVAILPVDDAVARALPQLGVTRRGITGGLFDGITSALTSARVVDLESAELHDRYRVSVRDETSEVVVRRLFEPAFMVWLSDAASRDLEFELESGHLVLWRKGHLRAAGPLDGLIDDADQVSERLRAAPEQTPRTEEQKA